MDPVGNHNLRPEEPVELIEVDYSKLEAFGHSLARTRAEAISGRQASGVEDLWREDEEYYEGIDERNRHDERQTWRHKPPGQISARAEKTPTRSTVFPNITGPFCDSAAARIADMLLPSDDRNWAIKPTPIPDLEALAKDEVPEDMAARMDQQYSDPAMADQAKKEAVIQARQQVEEAKRRAKKATKRIEDWQIECQWHAEVRKVIEDSARIGTGVLKGPVPIPQRRTVWRPETDSIEIAETINPCSRWIDPWNFYPDPACGENIHNGAYTWERDYMTRKQLRELIGQEGYIEAQIYQALKEGPSTATAEYRELPDEVADSSILKNKFEIWYYYGTAEREDLEAAGCDCGNDPDPHLPVVVTMVNNRVIRASMAPLDTGDLPYDVMVWRRRAGHWTGIGVARQIRVPQKIVTGATRNMMDNAGIAAGPLIVFKQGAVYPADGVAGISARKVYYIAEDEETITDATKAIGTIKIDMLVNELMAIVQFGVQLAETVTNMPMMLQGQMGPSVPDTYGGQQLFQNNASTVLRRLARIFDDRVTEPHIRRYYTWLLQYGEHEDEKGDFSIDARGSSALVEREIQNQELIQMGRLVLDPRFGKDPKKWMDEYLKSRHFDPKQFTYDDEQWQQIVANMAQGPQDNSMAVAELRSQTEQFKKGVDEKLKQLELQHEAEQNQADRELKVLLKSMDQELDSISNTTDLKKAVDKIKADVAQTTMKLRVQKELHGQAPGQVVEPSVEPPGRAPDGQAYAR